MQERRRRDGVGAGARGVHDISRGRGAADGHRGRVASLVCHRRRRRSVGPPVVRRHRARRTSHRGLVRDRRRGRGRIVTNAAGARLLLRAPGCPRPERVAGAVRGRHPRRPAAAARRRSGAVQRSRGREPLDRAGASPEVRGPCHLGVDVPLLPSRRVRLHGFIPPRRAGRRGSAPLRTLRRSRAQLGHPRRARRRTRDHRGDTRRGRSLRVRPAAKPLSTTETRRASRSGTCKPTVGRSVRSVG